MKITKLKIALLLSTLLITISSCKKDEPEDTTPPDFNAAGGIYIANEGNFQHANSSITYFNPANNNAITDIFKNVNGHNPGDVCQSTCKINNKLYIVVNNSGKIEVCNLNSMKNEGTITGMTSPRYILKVDSSKAYVSDIRSNNISIINLNTNSITSSIPLNGATEEMALINDKVYVANYASDYLIIIDRTSDQVTDSILITKGATNIVTDINGMLWVLCGSDWQGAYTGALHKIDPASSSVVQSFSFPLPDNPSELCINSTKDSICFINTNVYKMSVAATSLPSTALIVSNQNYFYSLGINPANNDIYVGDAIDYIQNGRVYRYSADGALITSFLAGIAPGSMLFF